MASTEPPIGRGGGTDGRAPIRRARAAVGPRRRGREGGGDGTGKVGAGEIENTEQRGGSVGRTEEEVGLGEAAAAGCGWV